MRVSKVMEFWNLTPKKCPFSPLYIAITWLYLGYTVILYPACRDLGLTWPTFKGTSWEWVKQVCEADCDKDQTRKNGGYSKWYVRIYFFKFLKTNLRVYRFWIFSNLAYIFWYYMILIRAFNNSEEYLFNLILV